MRNLFILLLCLFTTASSICQTNGETIVKVAGVAAATIKALSDSGKKKQQKPNEATAHFIKSEKYYLGGEITDENGNKVEGALLVLTIGSMIQQKASDASGFYVFELDLNSAMAETTQVQITFSKGACSKKERFYLTKRMVLKDLRLDCNSSNPVTPSQPPTPTQPQLSNKTFKKDNLLIEILECRQGGQEIECSFNIHAKEKDVEFWLYGGEGNSILFEAGSGNEYYANQINLAEKYHSYQIDKKIIAGYPIKGSITFTDVTKSVSLISVLQLNCWSDAAGYFSAEIRNIPVNH